MPVYPGSSQAQLIYENRQIFLFQREVIITGQISQAVQLRRERGAFYPWGFSLHFEFTNASGVATDPGAVTMDVQEADLDKDSAYVNLIQLNAANLNASFIGKVDLTNFWAKYIRVKATLITNAVSTTILATR